jgi:cytochrome P450
MNDQATELSPPLGPGTAPYRAIPTQRSSVVRQILAMRRDLVGYLMSSERIHGPVWRVAIGRGGMTMLLGPDALEFVWKNREGAFSSARGWQPYIGRIFPGAIMAMDGDDHRYQRRIMQVAFQKSALRTYLAQMNPAIAIGIKAWMPAADRSAARKMFPLLKQLTLDLAASVFMGVELGRSAKDLNRAFVATVAASLAIIRVPVPGLTMARNSWTRNAREALPRPAPGKTRHPQQRFLQRVLSRSE